MNTSMLSMSNGHGIHFKGLNGIRAIAALSVVITHVLQGFEYFGLPRMDGLEMAGYGVTMFFTLSGFLITYLLLLEKEKYKDINIKQFYIRRILRIWPLYYFYLILAVLAILIYDRTILDDNLVFYVVLLANIPYILGTQIDVIGHFWSLGVEEQFYLFWPWVFKKCSNLLKWLIIFILFLLLLKLCFWIYYYKTGNPLPLYSIHITRFHCMALGALGAVMLYNKNEKFLKFAFHFCTQFIIWSIIAVCAVNKFHIAQLINDEIIAITSVFLIINVSSNPKTFFTLENRYINYLGKISFGIYVYHPLIIFLIANWFGKYIALLDTNFQYVLIFLIIVPLTIIVAGLSYRFFETPFLKLKTKFAKVKSSATG